MPSGELLLPNGKLLGHREFRHFYKIYYRPISDNRMRIKAIYGENYKDR